MHIFHKWTHLEYFITENRRMERQKCSVCNKTRVTYDPKEKRGNSTMNGYILAIIIIGAFLAGYLV